MRKLTLPALLFLLSVTACSPKISTDLQKSYNPLDYKQEIRVLELNDPVPDNSEILGVVKVGDSGFTVDCGYDIMVDLAKLEARKAGGNALKIIEHLPPSMMGSSCHIITAKILKVSDFTITSIAPKVDSVLANADYALVHVYRFSGTGGLISFDLHLGDTVICRVSSNSRKTVKIKKDGLNSLWARTEVKDEIPVNFKIGHEYYVRCSITMGFLVGHPKLELVNNDIGKLEYDSFKLDKDELTDRIIMNDGKTVECKIEREDADIVYISILKKGDEIKQQINRKDIKEIKKGE